MLDIVLHILVLLAALSLFLFGMMVLNVSLQTVAGPGLHRTMQRMTSTTRQQIGLGFLSSALLQSSNAMNVAVVSFVNVGLLTLVQGIGVILGTNVGGTLFPWIIAFAELEFDLLWLAVPILSAGLPLLLVSNTKLRRIGYVILGFGLLLLSIDTMQGALERLIHQSGLFEDLKRLSESRFSVAAFVAAGVVVTAFIQSSTAMAAMSMVLCANGWVSFECGAALILGANLGVTSTANLAAVMTQVNGKRAALSDTLINAAGMIWALPLLGAMTGGIAHLFEVVGGRSPLTDPAVVPVALAAYHTAFNLLNAILLTGLIPRVAQLAGWILPGKGKPLPQEKRLRGMILSSEKTHSGSILQAQSELYAYAEQGEKMLQMVHRLFRETNNEQFHAMYQEILLMKHQSSAIYGNFMRYLKQLTLEDSGEVFIRESKQIFRLVIDIEIMHDYAFGIAQLLRERKEKKAWFDPSMRNGINEVFEWAERQTACLMRNLNDSFKGLYTLREKRETEEGLEKGRHLLQGAYLHLREPEEKTSQEAQGIYSELMIRIGQFVYILSRISSDTTVLNDYETT